MGTILTETEGFTPVIDVLTEELGLMTAVVYGIVWRYCQMENKVCSASRETIAKHANISTKTVDRHLDKLCKAGYLKDLHPEWKHRPHIYADTGKLKIETLVKVRKEGETESPTLEPGETESLEGETESPTGKTESLTGETQSLTKIPSYDSLHDSQLGKEDSAFPENPEGGLFSLDAGERGRTVKLRLHREKGEPHIVIPDEVNRAAIQAIIEQEQENPSPWDLARCTAALQATSGGPVSVPVSEGGAFVLGDRLITAACARLGRSEPEGNKRKSALAFFEKALRIERLSQGDPAMLERAVRDWLDPEGDYAFYLSQYDLNPKHELALRHFGIVLSKAKKAAADAGDRCAREQAHAEASQAAFRERRASKPPPKPCEEWDVWDKTLAQLEYHPLMDRRFFEEYLRGTQLLEQDDGVLVVGVTSEEAKDFIEGRLLKVIETELGVGLDGYPKAVRFEVAGDGGQPVEPPGMGI